MRKYLKRIVFSVLLLAFGSQAVYAGSDNDYKLVPINDQTIAVGCKLEFAVFSKYAISYSMRHSFSAERSVFEDFPEGSKLYETLSSPRMSLNPSEIGRTHTGHFTWTPSPSQAGKTYTVEFTAYLRYFNFSFEIQSHATKWVKVKIRVPPYEAPKFSVTADQKISAGQTLKLPILAKRADGQQVSQITMSPIDGMTNPNGYFDPATQVFTWTPGSFQVGKTFGVRFQSSEGGPPDKPAILDLKITVSQPKPPRFKAISDKSVCVNNPLTLDVGAYRDLDLSAVNNYNAGILGTTFLSGGAIIDRDKGMLTVTPNFYDAGKTFAFRVTASSISPAQPLGQNYVGSFTANMGFDPAGATATQDVSITVLAMKPPVFDPIGDQAVIAGQELAFYVAARGEDRIKLQGYTAGPVPGHNGAYPKGFIFSSADGFFRWSTKPAWPEKDYRIQFCVSGVCKDVKISVTKSSPPVFLNISTKPEVVVGNQLILTVMAKDPDGGSPTITMRCDDPRLTDPGKNPAIFEHSRIQGMTLNKDFVWTPNKDQVGIYKVIFTATDGEGERKDQEFTITVKPDAPPIITPVPNQTAVVGQTLTFDVTAGDSDGPGMPVLTMLTPNTSSDPYPAGAGFIKKDDSSWTGQFLWKIGRDQLGDFSVTFSATDGIEASTQTVKINVLPKIAGLPPDPATPGGISVNKPPPGFTVPKDFLAPGGTLADTQPPGFLTSTDTLKNNQPPITELPPTFTPPVDTTPPSVDTTPPPVDTTPPAPPVDTCTSEGQTKSAAEVAKSMEGVWDSRTWGTVYAKAIGSRMEGTYTSNQGRFLATVNADCEIEGRWAEYAVDPLIDQSGTFKIKTGRDTAGDYLGEDTNDDYPGQVGGGWAWRKFEPPATPEPDWYEKILNPGLSTQKGHQHAVCPSGNACTGAELARIAQGFAGNWETNEGEITATASGTTVQGPLSISGSPGKIAGTIQPDGSFKGNWSSTNAHGEFIFWIDPTGSHFYGHATDSRNPGFWEEGWQGEKVDSFDVSSEPESEPELESEPEPEPE